MKEINSDMSIALPGEMGEDFVTLMSTDEDFIERENARADADREFLMAAEDTIDW